MKNSENAARAASSIAMLSGRHCRTSGKDAHTQRNPSSNSSSTRILQVHHSPLQNGVTRLVPTVRTAEALEEDVGVQLFDRTGAHITLTAAGQVLLNYCEVVKTLLGQAKHELAALSGEHAGQLALGASTTIAQYVLPRLLGEFRREHPRVHPTLISGNTEHIVEAVEEQKIALGFIEGPARSREVKTQPFLEDELVLIASTAHEWTERSSVGCSEIASIPLLMRERGSGTRHVIELALQRQGVKRHSLNIAMELDSTEAIKSAVEAGLGIGFVSRWAIAKDMRLGRGFKIVEVEGLRINRQFLIAFGSGPEPQGVAVEFRRFVTARAGLQGTSARSSHNETAGADKFGK